MKGASMSLMLETIPQYLLLENASLSGVHGDAEFAGLAKVSREIGVSGCIP